jgi:hypothetical protein
VGNTDSDEFKVFLARTCKPGTPLPSHSTLATSLRLLPSNAGRLRLTDSLVSFVPAVCMVLRMYCEGRARQPERITKLLADWGILQVNRAGSVSVFELFLLIWLRVDLQSVRLSPCSLRCLLWCDGQTDANYLDMHVSKAMRAQVPFRLSNSVLPPLMPLSADRFQPNLRAHSTLFRPLPRRAL